MDSSTTAEQPTALLAVEDLHTHFPTRRGVVHAVNGVSFSVNEGELVGLVGESGCGKSVTARSIVGIVRPPGQVRRGSVRLNGVELRSLKERELRMLRGSRIGFVPQNPFGALNPVLKVERQFDNVIKAHRKIEPRVRRQMAHEMLERVGIAGPDRVLKGYAHELSGGMAQRVVIAMAMVLNPDIVIADEPTTGLDVTVQRQLLDLIMGLIERERRAMLFVTHDLGIVAQYCHKVIVMYAGKIVEAGLVSEVLRRPAHPYTQALLQAIPRRGASLVSLRGSVPNLIDFPQGCPFAARCAHAHDLCFEVEPERRHLTASRQLACHLPEGVTPGVARAS